jgi:hypothetical protein
VNKFSCGHGIPHAVRALPGLMLFSYLQRQSVPLNAAKAIFLKYIATEITEDTEKETWWLHYFDPL